MMMRSRRGQSVIEYAVMIAVVIAALLVMQIYMKHGVSGKLRESTDQVGEQFTPHMATYDLTRTYNSNRIDDTQATGEVSNNYTRDDRGRSGTESPAQIDIGSEKLWDNTGGP